MICCRASKRFLMRGRLGRNAAFFLDTYRLVCQEACSKASCLAMVAKCVE